MSRTVRRKNMKDDLNWLLRSYKYLEEVKDFSIYDRVELSSGWWTYKGVYKTNILCHLKKDSKEGKRKLAEYHSDTYHNYKEPGPSWFRNLTAERPQRREAKRQLKQYLLDQEFEVILNSKDPLEYWT